MEIADLTSINEVQRAAYIPELLEDMSIFELILENDSQSSFVAFDDGRMSAYVLSYPSMLDRDDFESGWRDLTGEENTLYIHDLCVHPDYRGQGIAQRLFGKAEAYAREKDMEQLAGIAVQNSENFWSKFGFKALKPFSYHGESGFLMVKNL